MGKALYVRDVPDHVREWIDGERRDRRMTQNEFVNSVLETVAGYRTPTLFDNDRPAPSPPRG
ncbi:MAG: hypothetical protein ABIF82_01065, partial [Planctomycetota bacterium]